MRNATRPFVTAAVMIALWWAIAHLSGLPDYMLPKPEEVAAILQKKYAFLFEHTLVTVSEILLGLLCGTALGSLCAILMMLSPVVQRWLSPILVFSQAMPVFAIAPLLVLWFGFGMSSKIVMAVLIIFFPVAAAFYDGLRRTEPGWLELAQTMNTSKLGILLRVRLPAALPAFGSGLRVAAAVAPIGAIVGEWVGSSAGLGYVMMNANAQVRTDEMFAALLILSAVALTLWALVNLMLRRLLFWAPDSH
ncbi:ABC transporter permease [Methyloligella sp. 2.7D]|uniref:ABC transporter permease n=1 Tax=unclassified Methyloligella TaxID=2625955 RepID=UPI00157DCCEC|nr:ABC transporter permease [Methyloligella sp. GL2]QKP77157.1 ABC transporter permease [Methyloligella sp. GL2]